MSLSKTLRTWQLLGSPLLLPWPLPSPSFINQLPSFPLPPSKLQVTTPKAHRPAGTGKVSKPARQIRASAERQEDTWGNQGDGEPLTPPPGPHPAPLLPSFWARTPRPHPTPHRLPRSRVNSPGDPPRHTVQGGPQVFMPRVTTLCHVTLQPLQ